jgi:thymidylate kinase
MNVRPQNLTSESHSAATANRSIETFGLCGAGKTTLLRRLIVAIQETGGEMLPSIETPVQPHGSIVWSETARIISRALSKGPVEVARFLAEEPSWWLPHKLGFRIAGMRMRRATTAPLLIDSGLLQPFVSFAIEWNLRGSAVPTDAFLSALSPPDLAIYVRTSPEEAYERYVTREVAAQRPLPRGDLLGRFHKGHDMCLHLAEMYSRLGLRLEVVDCDGPIPDAVLGHIAQSVLGHLSRMK